MLRQLIPFVIVLLTGVVIIFVQPQYSSQTFVSNPPENIQEVSEEDNEDTQEVFANNIFPEPSEDAVEDADEVVSNNNDPVKNSAPENEIEELPNLEQALALLEMPATPEVDSEGDQSILLRPPSLYPFPSIPFEEINIAARNALVNIICTTGESRITPISASGVIIDSRGIILTNAHVGQYFLLENEPRVAINCHIRTGSPAKSGFEAELVYLPPSWIDEHAHQIKDTEPIGTGEHDWALLRISDNINGNPPPTSFPFIAPEIREAAGFTDDTVLIASYPAGFLGGNTVQYNLYAASTITNIKKLFTFDDSGSVDLLSLGGVIVAQGGSSGGSVVNAWNRLVGLIVTSSDAETTAERDLRAITLAHIDRSIRSNTGMSLLDYLLGDISAKVANFHTNIAPELLSQLVDEL